MLKTAIAISLVLGLASAATAGDFYWYRSDNATLSFTDDIKRVPVKYRAVVQERTWAQVNEATKSRLTIEQPQTQQKQP